METNTHKIDIKVKTDYIEEQSQPDEQRYVFAYTITIRNRGKTPAKLVSRHWIITDGEGRKQEVRGAGVVGEQPHLLPGEEFTYTSGTVLETPVGCMEGTYHMVDDEGGEFETEVPMFTLSTPHMLH